VSRLCSGCEHAVPPAHTPVSHRCEPPVRPLTTPLTLCRRAARGRRGPPQDPVDSLRVRLPPAPARVTPQKLVHRNQMTGQYGLPAFTADDLDPWELDGEVGTTAVYGGYTQAAEACQEGRRLLLGLLLSSAALRRVAGWEADAVGCGYDYYLLRTHREGTIELSSADLPLDAYALYARLVADLAEELVLPDEPHRLGWVSPLLPATVRAWLYRDAREAIGDQGRVTAEVGLSGLVKAGDLARSARQPAGQGCRSQSWPAASTPTAPGSPGHLRRHRLTRGTVTWTRPRRCRLRSSPPPSPSWTAGSGTPLRPPVGMVPPESRGAIPPLASTVGLRRTTRRPSRGHC
jgi:hypothetical protein